MIYFLLQATCALRVKSTQDALCQSQAKDEGSALTFKMQPETWLSQSRLPRKIF